MKSHDRLSFQRRTGVEPDDYDRREIDPAPAHDLTTALPVHRTNRRSWRYGKHGPDIDPVDQ